MLIPSAKYLTVKARNRLQDGREPGKVILVYSGITAGLALIVAAIRYFLSRQISQTGGLSNIGIRSFLSTIDRVLPILQTVLLMCLTLGYTAAMLRIARRQYASPKTLKAGFERFWPLIISRIIQALIYVGLGIAVSYAAVALFMLSPFSGPFVDQVAAITAGGNLTPEQLLEDSALADILMNALTPMMIIYFVLYIPVLLAFSYRYRMTDYIIIDQPGCSGVKAMQQSRAMMKGNKKNLFMLDLRFWWYYALRILTMALLYGDLILSIFGIYLPFSDAVVLVITVVIYLAADFAVNYFCMNRYSVAQALAYHSIVKPPEDNKGAVLGNIFNI